MSTSPFKQNAVLAFLALAVLWSPSASAQSNVFEYEGFVASDGEPISGTHSMRFALFETATSADPLVVEEWSDEGTRSCSEITACEVDIFAGSFRVLLGRFADIGAALRSDTTLYVAIAIRDNAGEWHELSGRQEVLAAPAALWTVSATDLAIEVGGALDVVGDLTSTGTHQLEALGSFALFDISGEVDANAMRVDSALVVQGGLTVEGDTTVSEELVVSSATYMDQDSGSALVLSESDGVVTINPSRASSVTEIQSLVNTSTGDPTTTINGTYTIDAAEAGNIDTSLPVFAFGFFNSGTESLSALGSPSPSDYYCWIGGVRINNGWLASYPGGDGDWLEYDMSQLWGQYVATVDVALTTGTANREYVFGCIQTGLVEVVSSGGF